MAIADEKFKHGHIIAQVALEVSKIEGARVNITDSISRSGYTITIYNKGKKAGQFGLFIKCSNKRRAPWRYSFTQDHQGEIDLLRDELGEVFVALVNRDDGVACLSYELLKQLLDDNHEEVEWLSVDSKLNSRYKLSGKDGKLNKRIARNDFPRSIGLHAQSLINKLQPEEFSATESSIIKRLFGG